MFSNLRKISFVFIALFLLVVNLRAGGTSTFEGTVRDPKGQPIKGAEVRVENKKEVIVARGKTDASGHYVTNAVPVGVYKVDVVINSVTKSSVPNATTKSDGATQLNFATKPDISKRENSSHRTGSNLW
jgi:hypothetical protein